MRSVLLSNEERQYQPFYDFGNDSLHSSEIDVVFGENTIDVWKAFLSDVDQDDVVLDNYINFSDLLN